jgi:hypothetical protein
MMPQRYSKEHEQSTGSASPRLPYIVLVCPAGFNPRCAPPTRQRSRNAQRSSCDLVGRRAKDTGDRPEPASGRAKIAGRVAVRVSGQYRGNQLQVSLTLLIGRGR